jgi:heme o synthase
MAQARDAAEHRDRRRRGRRTADSRLDRVTGHVEPQALLLFLIIFIWTPPHFWALAIARRAEYAKVNIPMLPVTHGVAFTQRAVLRYSIALTLVTMLPFVMRMSGLVYLAAAVVLDAGFLLHALKLVRGAGDAAAMRLFRYSIVYLMWLFIALLLDHYLPTTQLG